MFTLDLICMQYLCVSILYQTMTQATGSLVCPHDLLMHVSTHMFAFFHSVRLNSWHFHGQGVGGGGGGVGGWGGGRFFFHSGGPFGPLL